jgi:hypothetical protein
MADLTPRFGAKIPNTLSSSGSATVHKGEPRATEIAKLRFRLTPDEDARLDSVLAASLEQYQQLSSDQRQLDDHLTTVGEFMRDEGWSTPLVEVYRPHTP